MKTRNTLAIALALALAMILVPLATEAVTNDYNAGDSEYDYSGVVLGASGNPHVDWSDDAGKSTTYVNYYAAGETVTIAAASTAVGERAIVVTYADGTSETIDPENYGNQPNKVLVIFGGDHNAAVASSNLTINSGIFDTIYGGGSGEAAATPGNVTTSNVTINGGTINNAVYGGGLIYATVENSTVTMNGGHSQFVMGGGACSSSGLSVGTIDDPYPSISGKATVNINGGQADYVMGGGQGYALVNDSEINFTNGTAIEVIGSGSNGKTLNSVVNIRGGEVLDYVFAVNRGAVADSAVINISGGTVANAYAGASQDSSNTTGSISGSASLNITGGDVGRIFLGTGIDDADVNLNVGERTVLAAGGFANNADRDYTIAPGKVWNLESGNLLVPYDGSLDIDSSAVDGRGELHISDNASLTLDGDLITDALNQIDGKVQLTRGSEIVYDFNGTPTVFASFDDSDSQIMLNDGAATMSFSPSSDFDPADPKNTAVDIGLVNGSFSINAEDGYTVTPDATLTVGRGATLNIPTDKTLYMYGDMTVNGSLINDGDLQIVKSATNVPNYPGVDFGKAAGNVVVSTTGSVVNRGTLDVNNGTFTNNGSVTSDTPIPGVPNVKPLTQLPGGIVEGDTLIYNLDPNTVYEASTIIVDSNIKHLIVNGNHATILGLRIEVPDSGASVFVECLNFEGQGLYIGTDDITTQWSGDVTVRFNTFNRITTASEVFPVVAAISVIGNVDSVICIDQNVIDNVIDASPAPVPNFLSSAFKSGERIIQGTGAGIIVATFGEVTDKSIVLIYSNTISNIQGDAIYLNGQFQCVHINDNTITNWDSADSSNGRAIEFNMSGYAADFKISYNTFNKTYVEPFNYLYGNILMVNNWTDGTPKIVFEYNTLNLRNLPASIDSITDERLTDIFNNYSGDNLPKYTVDFDLNGGDWSLPTTGSFVTGGAGIDQPTVSPTRSGYLFAGWTLNGQAYQFGTPITSDITLVAAWFACPTPQTYTVTFESNGGSAVPSQTVNYGGVVVKPQDPTKDGFTFGGWYCDAALTVPYNFCNAVYSSFTLYAKWVAGGEVCTVTFDVGGNISQVQVVKGTPVAQPADPVKDGYRFACWTLNGLPYNFNAPVMTDITLCANFVVGAYEQNGNQTTVVVDGESITQAVKDAAENGAETFVLIDASDLRDTEIVTITAEALRAALSEINANGLKNVNILLPNGSFSLDAAFLASLLENLGDSVSFVIEKVEVNELNSEQAAAVGDRPVYNVSIKDGDNVISSFNGNKIKVAIAYQLQENEDPAHLCGWYVNDAGEIKKIDATYENGYVIFESDHASYFAVGYDNAAGSNDNTIYYLLLTALVIVLAAGVAVYLMRRKQTI